MAFASVVMGQYIPICSPVHRLDPRAKIFLLTLIMVVLFSVNGLIPLGVFFIFFLGILHISHLPLKMIISSCRAIFFLACFAFLFNFLASPDLNGTKTGIFAASRLLLLVFFAILLPLTTAPLELADALESWLSPLHRFGFPSHECAMMMGIALRFIPLLMEETDKIMKAQISRGASLDQGRLFKRVLAFFPVLIPLFVIIFRRADELAVAMEARGYKGGDGRSRRKPLSWKKNDTNVTIFIMVFLACFLVLNGALK